MRSRSVLAALLLAGCSFDFGRELGPGEIRGRLVHQAAGAGELRSAGGAKVVLPGTTLAARADEEGRFLLSRLPPGAYDVRATFEAEGRALGLLVRGVKLEARAAGVSGRDLGSLALNALGEVSGSVTRGGAAVEGAHVIANGLASATTGADGRYALKLPHGEHDLAAVYTDRRRGCRRGSPSSCAATRR